MKKIFMILSLSLLPMFSNHVCANTINPIELMQMASTFQSLQHENLMLKRQVKANLALIERLQTETTPLSIEKPLLKLELFAMPDDNTYCGVQVYLDNPRGKNGAPSKRNMIPLAEASHSTWEGSISNDVLTPGKHSLHIYARFPGNSPASASVIMHSHAGEWEWNCTNKTKATIAGKGRYYYAGKFDFVVQMRNGTQTISPDNLARVRKSFSSSR